MIKTLSNGKEIKANKDHRCNFCGSIIRKGLKYIKSTHIDGGQVYDWKSHIYCNMLANKLNMFDHEDGIGSSEFADDIHSYHDSLFMCILLQESKSNRFSDSTISQLRSIPFDKKMNFLIRHFKKEELNQSKYISDGT